MAVRTERWKNDMKSYKKVIILSLLVTLLPILIGILLWNRLPEQLPYHWGINGEVDGWAPKARSVFLTPCLLAIGQLFLTFCTFADPKRRNIHRKPLLVVLWIIPVLSVFLNGAIYLIALGVSCNIPSLILALLGVLFIFIGNYLPKLQQNYTVGIKLPWTLADEDNWTRTHRLGGKMFVIYGLLTIVIAAVSGRIGDTASFIIFLVLTVISVLVPSIYSYLLFHGKVQE